MEERKPDYSSTQDDLMSKITPKSIIRSNVNLAKNMNERYFRKSKTTIDRIKKVSFPDKFNKPVHTIYEVEPIIYEDIEVKITHKSKTKGCHCIII